MFRTTDHRTDLLSELVALGGLSGRERRKLVSSFDEVTVAPGTVIIGEGTLNHHTYFVVEGRLAVHICGAEVAKVGPGEPVGERTALGARVANATVVAAEPTRLLILDHRRLATVVADNEAVEAALRELIARREAATTAIAA